MTTRYPPPPTADLPGTSVRRASTTRPPLIIRQSTIMGRTATSTTTVVTGMDTDTDTDMDLYPDPMPDGSAVRAGTSGSTTSASTRMCIVCTMAARRSYWPPDPRTTSTSKASTAKRTLRTKPIRYAFIYFLNKLLIKIYGTPPRSYWVGRDRRGRTLPRCTPG